ncbi:concanavalin A-like lectin/glucanase domain-containing protein [Xylariaceae sp. FL1019]|nr:concanavalin A-like lectin/glucanase domain-containing protein [Xylariaceae sp. FL1019]
MISTWQPRPPSNSISDLSGHNIESTWFEPQHLGWCLAEHHPKQNSFKMWSNSVRTSALALLASGWIFPALAQLTTLCDPMNKTCPADPALGTSHMFYFNSTPPNATFDIAANPVTFDETDGAVLEISKEKQSPTLASYFYFFFGRTEVHMKAAKGQGIISSIVWGSDTLDEVDFEFKGSNESFVFSNWYRNGVNDNTTGGDHPIQGSIYDLHNYTTTWTKEALSWYFDGQLLRTVTFDEAEKGVGFVQTPMTLRLGSWVAGDPNTQANGTIEWAQGITNFDDAPFTMYVQSAYVEDASNGSYYTYSDKSATWQSIKIEEGNSTTAESINKEPDKSISDKWSELPATTKTGIYAAAGAVGGLLFILLAFYYFKQRRRGATEAAAAAKAYEADRHELDMFKKSGQDPDSLAFDGTAYRGKGAVSSYGPVPDSDSPPASSHGVAEKAWDPTNSAMPSPMPLLHQDSTNRVASPLASPTSPVNRSFSNSSQPLSRSITGSSQGGGYAPINRVNSPSAGSVRSPGSPAPYDMYGMSRMSPGPSRGPSSPGPQR